MTRIVIACLLATTLTVACADSRFSIKGEGWSASEVCNGEGTLEFRMEDGSLTAKTLDDIETFMIRDGMPSAWCHGIRHVFVGRVTREAYVFESDADDPLQFVVDREKGYYYEQGTGTVTTPPPMGTS